MPRVLRLLILHCLLAAASCSAGCRDFDTLNALIPTKGYRLARDVPYGALPRQNLDVYLSGRAAAKPAPVVVFFYGGAWVRGQKADYRFVAQALSSKGFVAILPDYRTYPATTFPGFVEDGAKAVRWAVDHAEHLGGDPSRIYLMGHSAGAHIAALLALDPHYLADVGLDRSATVRGAVCMSGPYDFKLDRELRPVFNLSPDDPRTYFAMEPISFADAHAPPMLLVHGGKDDVVEPHNAMELMLKLREAGADVNYRLYPGLGHAGVALAFAFPFRWIAPVLKDVTDWIETH